MADQPTDLLELTTLVVAVHVESNRVQAGELPELIRAVHGAFAALGAPVTQEQPAPEKPKGAVSIRKSLADPAKIISMIDGKAYSTLKRHLGMHGHTPQSYRETYGLPRDYPMVAAAYSEFRRTLSKAIGLGRKKIDQAVENVEEAVSPVVDPAKQATKRERKMSA